MRAEHGEDCTLCEPLRERIAQQEKQIGKLVGLRINVENAHRRCSDALTTKNQRIERALSCVTENSAHVGKKMAAILRGER
ncbi:hypothetical protein L7H23_01125 [Sphingopyxis sp. BSN-002]|uniref:hypothetical protein n=1 Tax=Sphingopyxis sp. BSN-002 TaxID=2911495 RepID=UPI001EDC2EBE|nr:hypothetical protein [Sphingopyxis sp. BSN-002]UKK84735.1 hypothetical protein L7H23_01125 [Sphingopyxis sp. BSN-002]